MDSSSDEELLIAAAVLLIKEREKDKEETCMGPKNIPWPWPSRNPYPGRWDVNIEPPGLFQVRAFFYMNVVYKKVVLDRPKKCKN